MACIITSAVGAFGGNLSWQGWAILIALFVIVGFLWQIIKNSRFHLIIAEEKPHAYCIPYSILSLSN